MKKSIVITGIKHCGKTTLGNMLADRLGCAWYDLDHLVMNRPENSHWENIRELYKEQGKEYFQEQEALAADNYLARFNPGTQYAVLSLGGGTIENRKAMEIISLKSLVLYFSLPEELLYQRIMKNGRPPFLSEEDPQGDFHRLYEKRDVLNRERAHRVIELKDASKEENLERILEVIKSGEGD